MSTGSSFTVKVSRSYFSTRPQGAHAKIGSGDETTPWWADSKYANKSPLTRVRLHINSPPITVQSECLQSSLLTQLLNLVNILITTVVALPRVALRVLVCQTRSQALHNWTACEILKKTKTYIEERKGEVEKFVHVTLYPTYLWCNEFQPLPLSLLLPTNQIHNLRVLLS